MVSLCTPQPRAFVPRESRRSRTRPSIAHSATQTSKSAVCRHLSVDGEPDSRRQVIVGLMASVLSFSAMGNRGASAEDAALAPALVQDQAEPEAPAQPVSNATFKLLQDPVLAYSFNYPVTSTSGATLPMVLSRKPEKYSSAAPLTADARQRIVCELVSLMDALTVSVSVGPPSGTLKTTKPEDWTAKQLAEQVLLDRSTGRVTSGQRVSLSTVESARFEERDGFKYCIYETVSQGSPTLLSSSGTTYRHARAVTVMREGLDKEPFLYTLTVSCPQERWEDLQEPFLRAVESFKLDKPGTEYIPPNQDPWLFF